MVIKVLYIGALLGVLFGVFCAVVSLGKHKKYMPYVFTENGVYMLSTVLKSKNFILVKKIL